MKTKKQIIIPLLLIVLGLFSCTKDLDPKIIEFYKSQYRDPELFGLWQAINVKTTYIRYYKEGYYRYTAAKYNKKGEIIEFKDEKTKIYYYTKENDIFRESAVSLKGGVGGSQKYEIKNDTLFLFSSPQYVRIQ